MRNLCSIMVVMYFLFGGLSISFASADLEKQNQMHVQVDTVYQTSGVTDANLPVFYEGLKDKLTYPMSWNSGRYSDFNAWKKAGRRLVLDALPKEGKKSFAATVLETQDRGTYTAEKIAFDITPESRVLGLMLVPKGKGPFPAVLLLHDHGGEFRIGKEKLIKSWGDPAKEAIANSWSEKYFSGRFVGDELAKRGYVVFATDALGWGDRGPMKGEQQQALASNMFNLGSSLGGLMAYEDLRAADFLAEQPSVDKARVGALGFSMGAYRAWQVAALSDKVKAGVAVCWMGTTKGLMVPGNNQLKGQSAFQMLLPGIVRDLDYPDVASLAAPKPMLFYNGSADVLFPPATVQAAYDVMHKVWQSQKADEKLTTRIWTDLGHVFVQEEQDAAFAWLDRQLMIQ